MAWNVFAGYRRMAAPFFMTQTSSSWLAPFYLTDDYRAHTSCLTEVERYEKRTPKHKNGGKVPPQQLWMELIAAAVTAAPAQLQRHIQAMATLDNVPRKEKPFYNFTSNSLNLRGKSGETTVSEIWNYLKELRDEQQTSKKQQKAAEANTTNDNDSAVDGVVEASGSECNSANDQAKKAALENGSKGDVALSKLKEKESSFQARTMPTNKKSVKKAMKKVLKNAVQRSLTVKLLRKAVQAHLDVTDRSLLKDLIQQNLVGSKKFLLQGKTVTFSR